MCHYSILNCDYLQVFLLNQAINSGTKPEKKPAKEQEYKVQCTVYCTVLYCTVLYCTGGAVLQGAEAGPLRLLQLVRGAGGVREDGQGVLPLHLHLHL